MAETLYERAMRLLGRPITKAVDTDDADARIDAGAEPTDKKLEEAGEEAAAGGGAEGGAEGGAPGGEGEEGGGVPGDPGAGEGAGADEGAGEGEGEGEEGEGEDLDSDDIRELKKAFGLTDFDSAIETKESANIAGLLGQILALMQKQDAFQSSLSKELADMKAKHASGSGDSELRVAMKAVDEKVDGLQKLLENLHRTAPAAAQPRGITKAVAVEPATPKLTLSDITALAMKGEISASESARLTRMVNHNLTPAHAGN